MEYFICRALEIARLNEEQLIAMQVKEDNLGRALLPGEIQEIFSLPPLKEHYQIPEVEAAQSQYNQKVAGDLRRNGLYLTNTRDIEELHAWDNKVRQASDELKVDFTFRFGGGRKRKLSDQLDDD